MSDTPTPDDDAPAEAERFDEPPADDSDRNTHDEPPADDSGGGPSPSVTGQRRRSVRRYLNYGAIGLLALFALVAAIRFYLEASAVISTWVTPEYRSLFQAAFNLVVLLFAGGAIAWQLRRLGD
ncbi:MAG: hypothetical protein V5A23_05470 [Halobacteriales archaeon]